MSYLLVFLAVGLADVCWTKYFIEAGNKNATKAAAWSALIVLLGAFTTRPIRSRSQVDSSRGPGGLRRNVADGSMGKDEISLIVLFSVC